MIVSRDRGPGIIGLRLVPQHREQLHAVPGRGRGDSPRFGSGATLAASSRHRRRVDRPARPRGARERLGGIVSRAKHRSPILRSRHGIHTDTLGLMSTDAEERTVLLAERAFQAAMLASDADELDRLLHPELLAVGPDGQMIDKAGDLASHRSGVFKITELSEEQVRVKVLGDTAVTFVVLRIRGSIDEAEISGRMRYTRTWIRDGGVWRVVAAHISPASA